MNILFKRLSLYLVSLIIILIYYSFLKIFHIEINYTSSMPIGFYRKVAPTEIKRGDIVAVCLPEKIAKYGLERGYLDKGDCPSAAKEILKEVIAIPHDHVQLTEQWIIVNGVFYFSPYHYIDSHGKLTKKFVVNATYHDVNSYWIYGSNNIFLSWDSRYYGGVFKPNIKGVYQPIFTIVMF